MPISDEFLKFNFVVGSNKLLPFFSSSSFLDRRRTMFLVEKPLYRFWNWIKVSASVICFKTSWKFYMFIYISFNISNAIIYSQWVLTNFLYLSHFVRVIKTNWRIVTEFLGFIIEIIDDKWSDVNLSEIWLRKFLKMRRKLSIASETYLKLNLSAST